MLAIWPLTRKDHNHAHAVSSTAFAHLFPQHLRLSAHASDCNRPDLSTKQKALYMCPWPITKATALEQERVAMCCFAMQPRRLILPETTSELLYRQEDWLPYGQVYHREQPF